MADVYKCQVEVRWGDLDMLGHVNNTRFVEYSQEARLRFFMENLGDEFRAGSYVVVRRLEVDFERPLSTESGPLTVQLEVLNIGTTSFTIRHVIYDSAGMRAGAVDAVLVGFSTATNTSRALSDAEREMLTAYLATEEQRRGPD